VKCRFCIRDAGGIAGTFEHGIQVFFIELLLLKSLNASTPKDRLDDFVHGDASVV
jgi:hypothetical protein